MADARTLPLPFGVPPGHTGPVVVQGHHEQDPPVAAPAEGLPHGGDNPEIAGLPPSRLDNCSSCHDSGEIAPRQRELYRRLDGRLLCRACYRLEKRA